MRHFSTRRAVCLLCVPSFHALQYIRIFQYAQISAGFFVNLLHAVYPAVVGQHGRLLKRESREGTLNRPSTEVGNREEKYNHESTKARRHEKGKAHRGKHSPRHVSFRPPRMCHSDPRACVIPSEAEESAFSLPLSIFRSFLDFLVRFSSLLPLFSASVMSDVV